MAEVWFYHLEREPLDSVLVKILVGLRARGERVCAHLRNAATANALSQKLWSIEDTGFVVHGLDGDPAPERQPVLLTTKEDAANAADYRFYCEGLMPETLDGVSRASILFEGADEAALASARATWKRFKADGCVVKYWRQNESNRWEDQAAQD